MAQSALAAVAKEHNAECPHLILRQLYSAHWIVHQGEGGEQVFPSRAAADAELARLPAKSHRKAVVVTPTDPRAMAAKVAKGRTP